MFCPNCGKELSETTNYCPNCGYRIERNQNSYSYTSNSMNVMREKNGSGYGILSFFFPIAGVILYFVWRKSRPEFAKSCLVGFLISLGLSVLFIFALISSFM